MTLNHAPIYATYCLQFLQLMSSSTWHWQSIMNIWTL